MEKRVEIWAEVSVEIYTRGIHLYGRIAAEMSNAIWVENLGKNEGNRRGNILGNIHGNNFFGSVLCAWLE